MKSFPSRADPLILIYAENLMNDVLPRYVTMLKMRSQEP